MPARTGGARRVLTSVLAVAALLLAVSVTPAAAAPANPAVRFFTAQQIGQGWRNPSGMTQAGDVQRNGQQSFYLVDPAGQLLFYGRTSSGRFLAPKVVGRGFGSATQLMGGVDFNLDGIPDLLATFGDGRLMYYPGNGSGAFSSSRQIGRGWQVMEHVTALQFSVGGKPGVAATDERGVLRIYPTDGNASFGKPVQVGSGWNRIARVVGGSDWDRNGCSDLLAVDAAGALLLYSARAGCTSFSASQIGNGWGGMTWIGASETRAQGGFWSTVWATNAAGRLLGYPARFTPGPGPTLARGVLLVNKSYPLPSGYGSGLTSSTASAFTSMRNEAARQGLSIFIASGFRSYSHQSSLYRSYVARHGAAAADRFSARPGHSEHQTGLALDVNSTSGSFGSTAEGRWVAQNAHRYGFIVRYPQHGEAITGYMYEPWHLRYVGPDLAGHLHRTGLTLEEYLNVWSAY
ncbi:D-alanyl-D-alanine carboxypeptidase family protein [Pseudactinotalea suaedae]|uniref:D-alanyl-D-alanine carboxypeptidase family protein n=1 Tax=Pseudactinotalea suaedae TaxID=1524924 RepID=UPI00240E3976|nr:D-alanyl-D-alanine carboxypeptidase family protein [Pseudactinotalea suaedae]